MEPDQYGQRSAGNGQFMLDLELKTRQVDLKTRRVLDPIMRLEGKNPELRAMDCRIGQNVFVLTTLGVFVYSWDQLHRVVEAMTF